MTPEEKIQDELGQIVWRIETSFQGLHRGPSSRDTDWKDKERNTEIFADIERLKLLKIKIGETLVRPLRDVREQLERAYDRVAQVEDIKQ